MKTIRQLRRAQGEIDAARVGHHEALGRKISLLSDQQFEASLAPTQGHPPRQPIVRRSPGSLEKR